MDTSLQVPTLNGAGSAAELQAVKSRSFVESSRGFIFITTRRQITGDTDGDAKIPRRPSRSVAVKECCGEEGRAASVAKRCRTYGTQGNAWHEPSIIRGAPNLAATGHLQHDDISSPESICRQLEKISIASLRLTIYCKLFQISCLQPGAWRCPLAWHGVSMGKG
jgi:hypothetical protein